MGLGRREIVAEALALLDERGLDALSMRTLAARLGVGASALYWHVGGKAELIGLMSNNFYASGLAAAEATASWRDWLTRFAHGFRGALLDHRDSALLCAAAARERASERATAEALAAPLVARGLSAPAALSYQASVLSLVLGWAIYQQSDALHAHLARMIAFDASFATGLEAMVAGFADAP